ncbi:Protein bric-a-brac 1 [Gryllus bimaculatus]|nr:Protein bric-a-brac 1 [Gryllus bimaculatus]
MPTARRIGGRCTADSYQYQLQSMWQKCWNTNQSLVHNLRFRERGPLKSWRPETMAEAIFSVLKEGLSLSQAARKYDIPYPTFVLYANRVHNMLGPSVDGGADLRPKGRGRPQRILLGTWPEEHIRGVIRAVVFRDTQHIKEEPHLGYARLPEPLGVQGYGGGACSNGPEPTVSPGAAAAAAVAVVAQGLRQQMCSMVAAAQHGHGAADAGLANSLGLLNTPPPQHVSGGGGPGNGNGNGNGGPGNGHGGPGNGGPPSPAPSAAPWAAPPRLPPMGMPSPPALRAGGLRRSTPPAVESPNAAADGPSPAPSPLNAPLAGVELGIGVSGMTYKPAASFTSPRPETLFQEDIEDIVKSPQLVGSPDALGALKEPQALTAAIKMEPVAEGPQE